MAGIADEPLLRTMLELIRHRGPDDSGVYSVRGNSPADCAVIGNNRLSIIDLSAAGHQPMANEDGQIWIAYNGEVFNFLELRAELEKDGHSFRSRTDTEVLIHLYEKLGPAMVNRLNGMFAFALWDGRKKELLLARDRMGIKPLYWTQVGYRLYFASEIKALLACPEVRSELDPLSLYQYLSLLYVPAPATLFRGIFKLLPGHILQWRDGKIRLECYWDLRQGEYFSDPGDDVAQLSLAEPAELNRWLPFVKWLLLLPHFFVLMFLVIAQFVITFLAFFVVLFTGRWQAGMRDFVVGVERWAFRVTGYFMLLYDEYPPFSLT